MPHSSSPPSKTTPPAGRIRRQALNGLEVLGIVREQVKAGHPADQILSALYQEHREYGSRDRRFYSGLVFSWFRWRGWLQHLEELSSQVVVAYCLDAVEPHPAIAFIQGESQIRDLAIEPLGGYSLEEKAAQLEKMLKGHPDRPGDTAGGVQPPGALPESAQPSFSRGRLLPDWLPPFLPDDPALLSSFIEACQQRPPVWIRALKSSEEKLQGYLGKKEVSFEKSKAVPYAFSLSHTAEVTRLQQQHGDWFEIQDLASQCVGHIAAPSSNQSWWDVCCGSGGKSLHLADLMNGGGFLQATDTRRHALREFYRRSKPYGDLPLRIARQDVLKDRLPQKQFDGVLVDAPCSGLGTWPRNPDARWRLRAKQIEHYAATQRRILDRVAGCVAPNGSLVYAVCTLTRTETEDVINAFLAAHPMFQLDSFSHPITREKTSGMALILPWKQQGGAMFVARMRRITD